MPEQALIQCLPLPCGVKALSFTREDIRERLSRRISRTNGHGAIHGHFLFPKSVCPRLLRRCEIDRDRLAIALWHGSWLWPPLPSLCQGTVVQLHRGEEFSLPLIGATALIALQARATRLYSAMITPPSLLTLTRQSPVIAAVIPGRPLELGPLFITPPARGAMMRS